MYSTSISYFITFTRNQSFKLVIITDILQQIISSRITSTRHTQDYSTHEDISTQEDMACGAIVSRLERSVTNIIRDFSIPTGLPWHLVDDVYIPMNCDGHYHWVLVVIVLKERLIRVYDLSWGSRKRETYVQIQKLSIMFPTYIDDSGLFEKSDRTDLSRTNQRACLWD